MSALDSIYISPLDSCNLNCKYCYTKKSTSTLSSDQILDFIKKYQDYLKNCSHDFLGALNVATHSQRQKNYDKVLSLKSVIFCGGEVFLLPMFTNLVNTLLDQNIFISIITNGTIDKLDEIHTPHNCQLIVSFDGPEPIHDHNRGTGNFAKSKSFVHKALNLGFPIEIFYLITSESYPFKDQLNIFDQHITYLTDRLGSLSPEQIRNIRQNYPVYPPKNFGCNQLSLQSDGHFYGCCETKKSIGSLFDPLDQIISNYNHLVNKFPKCNDPEFHCDLT